jgi:hypothetical protein
MVRRRKLLNPEDLKQFTDSKQWHTFSNLTPHVLLSDGAYYVAEEGDVFWFFDTVDLVQTINNERNQEVFQQWTVNVEKTQR